MTSSGRTSSSSRQTSGAPSPASSTLPAPQRGTAASSLLSAQAGTGYVSPYPPLHAQNASSPAGQRTTALAGLETSTWSNQPSPSTASMTSQQDTEAAQKQVLIEALYEHRYNTLGELRRVERVFATLGSPDLTQPMTAAWMYYVNSNSLLTELRALTQHYPFSSECIDEAKRRVYQDPASNRSWNLCWLILAKTHTDNLIPPFARAQALRPEMWGSSRPEPDSVARLAAAFVREWSAALAQMLRYWETPPIKPRGG